MTYPEPGEYPPHAKTYIEHIPSADVIEVLASQVANTTNLLRSLSDEQALSRYAPGKWTIKETVGHMSDTERILSYRVLRIARGDATPLPGFEQEDYVPNAHSNERTLTDLLQEFAVVRESTLKLVRSLAPADWPRRGTVSNFPVTARGLIFTLAGHELHHFKILRERYLNGAAI